MRRAGCFLVAAVLFVAAGCSAVPPTKTGSSTTTIPRATASATSLLPEARQGGLFVEDPARGRLLLVGGIGTDGSLVTSTWSWDGHLWEQLNIVSQGIDAAFY